ncbi:BTB/POZ domain-containing protein DOT3 isoform X1 [Apium graveolens]|uniref:BTB/POZ domain-containing protein DOT3 isoform X1 n=1 Tax=Apium graveolens TaxID=4045 RepID=UPI003D7A2094
MFQSIPMTQQHGTGSDSDGNDQDQNHSSIVLPAPKVVGITDSPEIKDHPWYISSQVPTDLLVQVQGVTFAVHKLSLISKCGYIGRIELNLSKSDSGYNIKLENFPGGSETFETVLKFCYGFPVGLNPSNVAALRCAAEFLEMTEELEDGNLIYKTEAFLTFVVLSSWRDSIIVLKSCESLSPWAQNIQLVRRCRDSIAQKASRENPNRGDIVNNESWWFDDVATLCIDHFMRIITAVRANGTKPETIGSCIMKYAEKWLPSMDEEIGVRRYGSGKNELKWNISSGGKQGGTAHHKEHKLVIESLVSILPIQNEGVSCKFLLWMLKMATIYLVSPALIFELEKRVGMTLENANVDDLLIPSYTIGDQGMPVYSPGFTEEYTAHNIGVVQRILEHFLMHEHQQQKPVKSGISKLLDNYLAEVARDPNLSVSKFQALAETLPENARTCDDGLYRAIDIYLKSHPKLLEHEQRRLCKVMNCEKLSLDACMHAAQNDRLPLRSVIQVLFAEQVKIRAVMQGKDQTGNAENMDQEHSWLSTSTEITTLRVELEKVKLQMVELQRDYSELQIDYDKLHSKQRSVPTWSFGWKKIKKSSIFHKSKDIEESEDVEQRSPPDNRARFRRRKSIS